MRISDLIEDKDELVLPTIEVGDEVLVGKFKNRKAIVKGFTKDDHNQPVLKTSKGDQKLFKPRLSKLMVDEGSKPLNDQKPLFDSLVKAAVSHGSPTAKDDRRTIYPEFDRVVLGTHTIRFAAAGKAGQFMRTSQAENMVHDAGWMITVLADRREQYGLNSDGSQRWREFVEVRLEYASEGQAPYETPTELFHVTPTQNVASILQHGLEPRAASRADKHRYTARVHFATSMDGAERIKSILSKHDGHDSFAILRVDPKAVSPIFIDPEFRHHGVYTNKPVPAKAITKN
jgi:hypothetical protein